MAKKQSKLSVVPKAGMLIPTRRDLKFKLDPSIINEWHYSGGPVFTAFLNTFSSILPTGERFFIRSVRAYRDQLTNPDLKKAVTAFIGQEAMHGREHEEYNEAVNAVSPSARRFEALVTKILNTLSDKAPASFCLSGTIALEHFTALLGDAVLSDPRVADGADPRYKAIWVWHSLEECEHKAVAYDVWKEVMGTGIREYGLRSLSLVLATVIFWGLTIPAFIGVLRDGGNLTNVKGWQTFFKFTVGDIGMLRRQLGNYLTYFKPGFHPWDHDNREYLARIDDFLKYQEELVA